MGDEVDMKQNEADDQELFHMLRHGDTHMQLCNPHYVK